MPGQLPVLRWGIVGKLVIFSALVKAEQGLTFIKLQQIQPWLFSANCLKGAGMIASWFVTDLSLPRTDARAKHVIRAIGSSSEDKAKMFIRDFVPLSEQSAVSSYDSYDAVYNDSAVDIVYIATPHAFHKQNCLDAISAGKHVLCEKPFTINSREATEVIEAARKAGVFVMEGMWTRFIPLVQKLNELLHQDKVIGDIHRTFADFSLDMPLKALPPTSRLRDARLGAGSLLDIGIYSLTWAILTLEDPTMLGQQPTVTAHQTLLDGVDVSSSILLYFGATGRHGIVTSSLQHKTENIFSRVEGEKGTLLLMGDTASMPDTIKVIWKEEGSSQDLGDKKNKDTTAERQEQTFTFQEACGGKGFYYEADAIALDITSGKIESEVMPLSETLRVMQILDEVRLQGGARFPQDN